jgi:DNA gyrase subunit A
MVMAYLCKHTPLQTNFAVNLTCLVPTENPEVGRPERCELKTILWHFLHFRLDVVTARLEHELESLRTRIHVLEGFEKVFDALDEILRIVRKSEGKADAADTIMARFALDAEQTDAILELKRRGWRGWDPRHPQGAGGEAARVRQIGALLGNEEARWQVVRDELVEVQQKYGSPMSTRGGHCSSPRGEEYRPRTSSSRRTTSSS